MPSCSASDTRPFNARLVDQVCARRGWHFIDLDGGEGYLFAAEAGGQRVLSGAGAICAYPSNSATAHTIARDKAFTHSVLVSAGLASVPTELVFLETARQHLRAPGREGQDLLARSGSLSYPVFAKPNRGAHGDFAERIDGPAELEDYLRRVAPRHDQIVIQPVVSAPEYRVLVVGGKARFQYCKAEGGLVGTGEGSWQARFEYMNDRLRADALSPIPEAGFVQALLAAGMKAGDLAPSGAWLPLPGRRNLATGGQPLDFRTSVDPHLAELACAASAALGLDVAGIDLFQPPGQTPVVLEVNGNPSFASLEAIGRTDLALQIWDDILVAALGGAA